MGDVKKSAQYFKQSIHLTKSHAILGDYQLCQYSLGLTLIKHGNLPQAFRHMDEAISSAKKLKDKKLQCESLFTKAQMLVSINDVGGAQHYLKKAYKINSPSEEMNFNVKNHLKIVTKVVRAEDSLVPLGEDDYINRLPLFEKLGDHNVCLENYTQAVEYYLKAVDCGRRLNRKPSELAPLYYSVAQTYADLKDYENAMKYYKKELESRKEDICEECKTLMNLADCEITLGTYSGAKKWIMDALDKAKQANNLKLELNCWKALSLAQDSFNHPDKRKTDEKIEDFKSKHHLQTDDESSITGSQQEAVDSDVTDFSDTDNEEEVGKPRRKPRASFKRNEMGETPLHRACIAGKLAVVRRLIEGGHPVNPRDNAGWIPLHEAANNDHYDVVEYLLDHGAWVNDRGGKDCGGITPLHDSASCGNMNIMQLLIEKGASVNAKTNSGETPLESLVQWRQRAGNDLLPEVLGSCNDMVDFLKKEMAKRGSLASASAVSRDNSRHPRKDNILIPCSLREPESTDSDSDSMPWLDTLLSKSKRKRASALSGSDEDVTTKTPRFEVEKNDRAAQNPIDLSGSEEMVADIDSSLVDPDVDGVAFYRNAMKAVGSASTRFIASDVEPRPKGNSPVDALLKPEAVVTTDWLIDDLGNSRTSINQKRRDPFDSFLVEKEQTRNSPIKSRTRNERPLSRHLNQTKLHVTRESSAHKIRPPPVRENSSRSSTPSLIQSSVRTPSPTRYDVHEDYVEDFPLSQPISSPIISSSTSVLSRHHVVKAPMRIKVRIQDDRSVGELLLIPVTNCDVGQNVSWLSEAAANRYYTLNGLKPILRLSTIEGAVLDPHDKLIDVVNVEEEVIASVLNWDLPPLTERYMTACKVMNAVCYMNVVNALQSASVSRQLDLCDLSLKYSAFEPIFRSLQCQYSLQNLSLSGNHLGDNGMKLLTSSLTTLPNLALLDISCNNISSLGLKFLSDVLFKSSGGLSEGRTINLLTDLDLSYNPLGDSSSSFLADVINSLTHLSGLKLASCSFTHQLMNNSRQHICSALKGAENLRLLNVSYNNLGVSGVGQLLGCLRPDKLAVLDLSSTVGELTSEGSSLLGQHLRLFLNQDPCNLEELHLSDCDLTNECIEVFARHLEGARNLHHLSLTNNRRIAATTVASVANNLQGKLKIT